MWKKQHIQISQTASVINYECNFVTDHCSHLQQRSLRIFCSGYSVSANAGSNSGTQVLESRAGCSASVSEFQTEKEAEVADESNKITTKNINGWKRQRLQAKKQKQRFEQTKNSGASGKQFL